jgi:hypothetical protein
MKFNPLVIRKNFNEWQLSYIVNTIYDPQLPMGNVASFNLEDVIRAWLVGFADSIEPVIPRSLDWLERAISLDEKFDTNRSFHCQKLHWAKALGRWMHTGFNDVETWTETSVFSHSCLYEKDVWPKNMRATLGLDDYMAHAFQAECFESAIATYEKFHGLKTVSLKKTLTPREYAYALCLQRIHQKFDAEILLQAGRRMLRANLEENWFGRGQYTRARFSRILICRL